MPRRGRDLELLVEKIEMAIGQNANTKITSPAFLIDKVTREQREFDVLIVTENNHHTFNTAVECKDLSRKVDAPLVEGFITKCRDTDVQRGIIVSSNGFSQPALEKAKAAGILCFSMSQLDGFDWCGMQFFRAVGRKMKSAHFRILFDGTAEQLLKKDNIFFQGSNLNVEIMNALANNALVAIKDYPNEEGTYGALVNIINVGDFSYFTDNGVELKATQVSIDIKYDIAIEDLPLQYVSYQNLSADKSICQMITTKQKAKFFPGDISFLKKENSEFLEIVFTPDQKKIE